MKLCVKNGMAMVVSVLGLALVWTVPAIAAPTDAPSWWGADDGRTASWSWEFDTGLNPPVADFSVIPDGIETAWEIKASTPFDEPIPFLHHATLAGRDGVWGYDGTSMPWDYMQGTFLNFETYLPGMQVERVWFQVELLGATNTRGSNPEGSLSRSEVDLANGWRRLTEFGEFPLVYFDPLDEEMVMSSPYECRVYNDLMVSSGAWASGAMDQMHLAVQFAPAPVPEPASMLLLGSGLLGIVGLGSRKKREEVV